jgi:hypothetical protein
MKALVSRHSLAREAMGKIAGVVSPRASVAPFAPIALRDVDAPVPRAPDGVVCDTELAGICVLEP